MNRIDEKFKQLKERGEKGFIAYIGGGDPDLDATHRLALAFDAIGVDVLEIGVPFSDPLADGLVNQLAAQRGLASGTTPHKLLETVRKIRESSQIPIVFYIYYNLMHHFDVETFVARCAQEGVDGLLVLDLPPEESAALEEITKRHQVRLIYLMAPTTPSERMAYIAQHASGFIYYVSREGVTGMQDKVADNIESMTRIIRDHTHLPVAVGFGISNPEQARFVARYSDAIVVGSAIVNQISRHGKDPLLVDLVKDFTSNLVRGAKTSES